MKASSDRPLSCCNCGRKIPKWTETVWVKPEPTECDKHSISRVVYGCFQNKADCQRASNAKVVSVSYHERYTYEDGEQKVSRGLVRAFTTWDGVSYDDPYFCNGACAKAFGYKAARQLYGEPKHKGS